MEENKEIVAEVATEKPKVDEKIESLKVKKPKMKKSKTPKDNIYKVGGEKPEEKNETKEEVKNDNTDNTGVVKVVEDAKSTQEQKEVQPETKTQEQPVLEEVTEEEAFPEKFVPKAQKKRKPKLSLKTKNIPEAPPRTIPELSEEASKGLPK